MIEPRQVTDTVVGALLAAWPRVGDHEAPDDRGYPYLILSTVPGGARDGSHGDPHEDVELVYQVRSVGVSRAQAQAALARARTVFLERANGEYTTPLAGAGWVAYHRELDADAGVGHEPGSVIYDAAERYRLAVTRA